MRIPADVEAEIRERVASDRYPDDAAVIRAAMDALDRIERRRRLLAALAEGEEGEGIPLTPELWAEIEREADEADRMGLPIAPGVCP
jgi:Arc/MetJ-type ribon-helix-helix transcriptional regulator